jgi:hypothetical protein
MTSYAASCEHDNKHHLAWIEESFLTSATTISFSRTYIRCHYRKALKICLKQTAMKCFCCHHVEETLDVLQHKMTEQSLCEDSAAGVENCETYSSPQISKRSQNACYGNYENSANCFHYSWKYKLPLCLEYDCNSLFLQELAASEFLLLKDRELRSAHTRRLALHPVVSNSFHKHAHLVRSALGHTHTALLHPAQT